MRDILDVERLNRQSFVAGVHAAVGLPEVYEVVRAGADREEAVAAIEAQAKEVDFEFASKFNSLLPYPCIRRVQLDVVAAYIIPVYPFQVVKCVEGGIFGPFDYKSAILEAEVANHAFL
jgi:hypothetical protein